MLNDAVQVHLLDFLVNFVLNLEYTQGMFVV